MILKTQKREDGYFLSQPHQPFFVLGVVNAILCMFVFMLAYKGIVSLTIAISIFHAYSLIFLVFTNFFIGFLFTTFPRFTQSSDVSKRFYTALFYSNIIGSVLFFVSIFSFENLILLPMLILLMSQVFMILKLQFMYQQGISLNKKDSFWILIAQYFGIVGQILFIGLFFNVGSENLAVNLSFYLYLVFLTFGVAQRMIPFFSHSVESKDSRFVGIVFILFVLKVVCGVYSAYFNIKIFEILLDLLIGYYILKEFLSWKLLKKGLPAILWILHLGLFWLPIAFLISAFIQFLEILLGVDFYFLGVHLVALGFLTTLFIGFGTRVVLGHSGQAPYASNFVSNVFLFVQVIVVLRMLYSINIAFGWDLNFIFDMTAGAWLILFLVWGNRYGKILFSKKF